MCESCVLTRTRPADDDADGMAELVRGEMAKRRLIFQLAELGLPVSPRDEAARKGLAFDLLSSTDTKVITGHDNGVITLDLAEADDEHRAHLRQQLNEPYRTLLGHFRHEIGHYYWPILVDQPDVLGACRALFGDDREDYAAAVKLHYDDLSDARSLLDGQPHQPLRHHASLRGLGRDLRPLPAHPRHPADGGELRPRRFHRSGTGPRAVPARRSTPPGPTPARLSAKSSISGSSSPTPSTRSIGRWGTAICTRSSWPRGSSANWRSWTTSSIDTDTRTARPVVGRCRRPAGPVAQPTTGATRPNPAACRWPSTSR